jgi:hypothetical protein
MIRCKEREIPKKTIATGVAAKMAMAIAMAMKTDSGF